MITCQQVTELMTDAMEDALDSSKRRGFDFHLTVCPFCRNHRHQVEVTVDLLRRLPSAVLTDDARAQALAAFRSRVRKG